jgi:hypothetical protein
MTDRETVERFRRRRAAFKPWTSAGEPDPDYDDITRAATHRLLTAPDLVSEFDRRFPQRGPTPYDEMVRHLGYVWDCPHDRTANVTGHRCATCRRTLAVAKAASERLAG